MDEERKMARAPARKARTRARKKRAMSRSSTLQGIQPIRFSVVTVMTACSFKNQPCWQLRGFIAASG